MQRRQILRARNKNKSRNKSRTTKISPVEKTETPEEEKIHSTLVDIQNQLGALFRKHYPGESSVGPMIWTYNFMHGDFVFDEVFNNVLVDGEIQYVWDKTVMRVKETEKAVGDVSVPVAWIRVCVLFALQRAIALVDTWKKESNPLPAHITQYIEWLASASNSPCYKQLEGLFCALESKDLAQVQSIKNDLAQSVKC